VEFFECGEVNQSVSDAGKEKKSLTAGKGRGRYPYEDKPPQVEDEERETLFERRGFLVRTKGGSRISKGRRLPTRGHALNVNLKPKTTEGNRLSRS